jgi:SAM-dependent methyltransferase
MSTDSSTDPWLWKVGNRVYTTTAKPPCRENITTFLNLALPRISAENYSAIVVGRVLYDIKKTNDFDLWLQGPVSDYTQLEKLLFNLYDIAYEDANLILDVKWSSVPWSIYNDSQHGVVNRDAESISINYYELQDSKGNHWKLDRKNDTAYLQVSDWLVKRNFKSIPYEKLKPHQIEYAKKFGRANSVPVEEFLQNLDHYLEPLEKPLPKYNFIADNCYIQENNKNLYNIFNEDTGIDYTQSKVLDFGCNQGNYIIYAHKIIKSTKYVGIDVNFPSIEIAKIKHPAYKFVHYNKWHPSFNPNGKKDVILRDFVDNDFDVVVAYSVFTHTTVDQTREILDEIYQVIKPGGTILFTIFLSSHFERFYYFVKNRHKDHNFAEYQNPNFDSVIYWTDYTNITADVNDLDINLCGSLCTFWKKESFEKLFPQAKFVKKVTDGGIQWLYRIDKPINKLY